MTQDGSKPLQGRDGGVPGAAHQEEPGRAIGPRGGDALGDAARPEVVQLFRRKEQKYEVGSASATFLREEIARRLPLFEFDRGHPYTFVTTLYFDTRNRDFYRRAERSYEDNIKIRVKEYFYPLSRNAAGLAGPARRVNGAYSHGAGCQSHSTASHSHSTAPHSHGTAPHSHGTAPHSHGTAPHSHGTAPHSAYKTSPLCYVELKQTAGGEVIKKRFGFPKRDLPLLLGGQDVWPILLKMTPPAEIGSLKEVYRELMRYMGMFSFEITSIVNYRRTVYQESEEKLRITFDDHLAVYRPPPHLYERADALTPEILGTPIRTSDKVILEIKCPGEYPAWLEKAMQYHSARRLSKFTTSVRLLIDSDVTGLPGEARKSGRGSTGPAGDTDTQATPGHFH